MLNKNIVIPKNVMELENGEFYDFIKQFSGEKVVSHQKFQDISNVDCFLDCNDPFEILSFDSNDLLDLKKEMCVKLNNNSYAVLPGVKCKANLLTNALMKVSNQLKKTLKTPNIVIENDLPTTDLMVNNANNSRKTFSATLLNTFATPKDNLITEDNIKRQIVESLND